MRGGWEGGEGGGKDERGVGKRGGGWEGEEGRGQEGRGWEGGKGVGRGGGGEKEGRGGRKPAEREVDDFKRFKRKTIFKVRRKKN